MNVYLLLYKTYILNVFKEHKLQKCSIKGKCRCYMAEISFNLKKGKGMLHCRFTCGIDYMNILQN